MSAHTPGPWKAHFTGERGYLINGCDGDSLAGLAFQACKRREETEANAELIAAAPELLAALKEAERVLRIDAQDHANIGSWKSAEARFVLRAADSARAAIEKAGAK